MNQANELPVPRDRGIWIKANVIEHDEAFTSVEPYEGYAEWKESSQIWVDLRGMTIMPCVGDKVVIHEWCELAERAARATDSELSVDANIYYWDETVAGVAGFFVMYGLRHRLTGLNLVERREGPLPTRGAAQRALAEMLTEPTADLVRLVA